MTISTEGWKKWLQEHSTNANYNKIANKIKGICNNASHTVNFESLVQHKTIVLLTKAPLGAKIQASFFHSIVGIPILTADVYKVARVGMTTGVGMEVESDLLFTQTSVWYRPLMVHMMKVSSLEELNNLTVDKSKANLKCKCYGLLTPHLEKQ